MILQPKQTQLFCRSASSRRFRETDERHASSVIWIDKIRRSRRLRKSAPVYLFSGIWTCYRIILLWILDTRVCLFNRSLNQSVSVLASSTSCPWIRLGSMNRFMLLLSADSRMAATLVLRWMDEPLFISKSPDSVTVISSDSPSNQER